MEKPTQSSNLKRMEEIDDQISRLPDALLLHILSFLKMNDVFKTSVLSKRWRYLSAYATCLDFSFPYASDTKRIVNLIDRSIISHEGSKVQKFCIDSSRSFISLLRDCPTPQIDSWIRFAIRRNVQELTLDFRNNVLCYRRDSAYQLPRSVFNCTSLTTLNLGFRHLNLPASVHLPSLQTLALSVLYISTDVIKRLTSSCPLIEKLVLYGCNVDDNLNIVIENKNLKSLEIFDHAITWEAKSKIIICAPYLISLSLWFNFGRVKYCLENLPSLVTASFYELYEDQVYENESHGYEGARLLGDLHHVKELNISSTFIGGLSAWGMQKLNSFAINATRIQLNSDLTKWDLPGICYLLRNSSKLEDLTIRLGFVDKKFSSGFRDQFGFEERGFWESMEFDFRSAMQNLKTVKIYLCSRRYGLQSDGDTVCCDSTNMLEFIKFLLKNSMALERMILNIGKSTKASTNNYKLLSMFTESMINLLPRASSNVEFHIV